MLVLMFYVYCIINNNEKNGVNHAFSLNNNGGMLHSNPNNGLNGK